MGIIDGIRRLVKRTDEPDEIMGKKQDPNNPQVGNDFEGKELFSDDVVADIKRKLEKRPSDRRVFELQWLLNSNFLAGHQYCDVNTYTNEIQEIQPLYDYSERGIYNRIQPLMETRLANMKTVKYAMTVNPRTNELDDWEKADISTKLLRYTQSNTNFARHVSDTFIPWSELTGTVFVMSWWDTSLGKEIDRSMLAAVDGGQQQNAITESLYEGDLNYGALSSYEVFPESLYKQEIDDQHDIIVEQVLSVEEIYDKYNVRVKGKQCDTYTLTPLPAAGGMGQENTVYGVATHTTENSEKVIIYFERKSRAFPDGRVAIIVGDKLIYYGDLPYDKIPIVAVKSKVVVGQFFGKSVIQDLIPLQRAYNGVCNKILEYIQTVASNPMIVADGSIDDIDDLVENGIPPNKILVYKPDVAGGNKPSRLENQALPNTVTEQYNSLKNDMEYTAGISQLMVYGATPSGIDSGKAIENLRQIDSTRLSLTTENIRSAIMEIAKQWLQIYKRHMVGYRVCLISGMNDVGGVVTWCADDINSFDIEYDTENELVLSEDKQRENFIAAYNMGLFTDSNGQVPREIRQKFLELMKLGRYSDMMGIDDLQRQAARRENTFFLNGVIPKRSEYDDDDIHLYEHKKFVLQMKFRIMQMKNPEYCAQFYAHMKEHESAVASMAAQQILQGVQGGAMAAPKT